MIIQDAQTGKTGKVDHENRLHVFSVTQTLDRHANSEGLYSSIYFTVTPTGANDYCLYLKNDGVSDVLITDLRISSTVPTNIFVDHVTGTPSYVTGTDATITNNNLGSNKSPSITAKFDTNITGITNVGELMFQECPVANTMYHLRKSSTILIPQGQAIAIRRVESTGLITALVSLSIAGA